MISATLQENPKIHVYQEKSHLNYQIFKLNNQILKHQTTQKSRILYKSDAQKSVRHTKLSC